MKTQISHYSTGYDYKPFIKLINNKYKFFVNSNFTYRTTENKKCFDYENNFLGYFTNESFETKIATEEIKNCLSLTQINYDFKLLPLGRGITIDEIYDCCKTLNNSFDIIFKTTCSITNINYGKFNRNGYYEKQYKRSEENFTPYEITKIGNSRDVINKNYKIALNFDIKKYKKNKDNFIKNNPEFELQCNALFNKNIRFMMAFWQMTEEQILNGKFNKRINVINKLNRKITNYETNK